MRGFLHLKQKLLRHPQIALPILIHLLITNVHTLHPLLLPLIQFCWLHSGNRWTKGSMGPGTVRTQEYTEIERGPWMRWKLHVGPTVPQSAHYLLEGLLLSSSLKIFYCWGNVYMMMEISKLCFKYAMWFFSWFSLYFHFILLIVNWFMRNFYLQIKLWDFIAKFLSNQKLIF